MDIDPITGLPKELESFEHISKEQQSIKVSIEKRKFGKKYTIIEGLDPKSIDVKDIAKSLKSKFACGGTFKEKEGKIELQGDYSSRIRKALVGLGFDSENIVFN
jgi:translation initiation factor 1